MMLVDAARFLWWRVFGERIAERKLRRELEYMRAEEMMNRWLASFPVIEIHINPITQEIINELRLSSEVLKQGAQSRQN